MANEGLGRDPPICRRPECKTANEIMVTGLRLSQPAVYSNSDLSKKVPSFPTNKAEKRGSKKGKKVTS